MLDFFLLRAVCLPVSCVPPACPTYASRTPHIYPRSFLNSRFVLRLMIFYAISAELYRLQRRFGLAVKVVGRDNEVSQHRAHLVLG